MLQEQERGIEAIRSTFTTLGMNPEDLEPKPGTQIAFSDITSHESLRNRYLPGIGALIALFPEKPEEGITVFVGTNKEVCGEAFTLLDIRHINEEELAELLNQNGIKMTPREALTDLLQHI